MSFKNKTLDLCTPNKPLNLAKKIVIVDGMIGGGKGLLASIVSSLPNVEMWLDRPQLEQVCALYHLDHLSLDAAKTLINTWMEDDIINQSMSRHANFKPIDASSVFHDARPLRYFKRLFKTPLKAKESIEREMPILNLTTHVNTSYSKPLFEALGERLVYIRVSRHPMSIYMLKHNRNWTERWRKDDRHGTIMYKAMDQKSKLTFVPFYANIIEVPYEKFVFHPEIYIKKIASSLGVTPDNKTNKMMRRTGVPRSSLTDAPKNKYYLDMGWKPPKKKITLAENFAQGRTYAAETASVEALNTLDKLAEDYEARYDINK